MVLLNVLVFATTSLSTAQKRDTRKIIREIPFGCSTETDGSSSDAQFYPEKQNVLLAIEIRVLSGDVMIQISDLRL